MAQSKKSREHRAIAILNAWSDPGESLRPCPGAASVRLRRREQRKKSATLEPKCLNPQAESGIYHVDRVIAEVTSAGFISAATIEHMRETIWLAAAFAAFLARGALVGRPLRLKKVKRFFNDLMMIERLIARNKELTSLDLLLSTKLLRPVRPSATEDMLPTDVPRHAAIRDLLLTSLQKTTSVIAAFRESHKPEGNPGNHDPLTRSFLDEMLELWSEWFLGQGPGRTQETRLFARFCSAVWLDVGFPTKDEAGLRLEDWIFDRVRKQFSDGVRAARVTLLERRTWSDDLGCAPPPAEWSDEQWAEALGYGPLPPYPWAPETGETLGRHQVN